MKSNEEAKIIIRNKMRDLYRAVIEPHNVKRLKDGGTLHLTLTLDGPYELWVEDKPDHKNPLKPPDTI